MTIYEILRERNSKRKIVFCKNDEGEKLNRKLYPHEDGFFVTRIDYEGENRAIYELTTVNQCGNDAVTVNLSELYDDLIMIGEVID